MILPRSVAAVLLAASVASCSSPAISSDQAATIAKEYAVAGQPSDAEVSDVTVGTVSHTGTAYDVHVDLLVRYPGPSQPPVPVHYIIEVDAQGHATILAQG